MRKSVKDEQTHPDRRLLEQLLKGTDPPSDEAQVSLALYQGLDDHAKTGVAVRWYILMNYRNVRDPWNALGAALNEWQAERSEEERQARLAADLKASLRHTGDTDGQNNVLVAFYDKRVDKVYIGRAPVKNRFKDIKRVDDLVREVIG